ncbi:MAG TPA: hypothetical protein VLJ57_13165 [Burkholderiaceae bacterium]|nr:hypothetical protein [Burkholderiaceae bacterium]
MKYLNGTAESPPDTVAAALHAALMLPDASFVVFRRGFLVEFKTDRLTERLSLYGEGDHRSWQIGAFEDHHCHPDLSAVRQILFDAEPVSCQKGRINYTVWFLGSGDCGNPYRPDGLFSVTLNCPYDADGRPRRHIIDAVFALFERVRGWPRVEASPRFLAQLGQRNATSDARRREFENAEGAIHE